MSDFEDIIIDGGPGDVDMSERTGFNPDAHEVVDVYDSSDEEKEEDEEEEEEDGSLCPICISNKTDFQCSSGHMLCKECLKRHLSLKRRKLGDPSLSCCLFHWCYAKY